MGMYTGLRFKGIVKEEFRNEFEDIALDGTWGESNDEVFKQFGSVSRADFIPCGALAYMPDEWGDDDDATDGFDRTYNKESGRWTFQCSLKNYEGTIQKFLDIVPYFIEAVEHAEVYYEEWCHSTRYELINGKMKLTDDKFMKYGYDYDDWYY